MAGDPMVLLATAGSEVEASIWRDALEQEGIRPFVRNRAPLAYLGSDAIFSTYEVFVLKRDLKRARWIIGEFAEPHHTPDRDREEEQQTAHAD